MLISKPAASLLALCAVLPSSLATTESRDLQDGDDKDGDDINIGVADTDLDLSTRYLPFTYEKDTTAEGYGYKDWDLVDEDQYYFPWERYMGRLRNNQCRHTSNQKNPEYRQSPIDITNEDNCDNPRK
jgi:hypothetical protein